MLGWIDGCTYIHIYVIVCRHVGTSVCNRPTHAHIYLSVKNCDDSSEICTELRRAHLWISVVAQGTGVCLGDTVWLRV